MRFAERRQIIGALSRMKFIGPYVPVPRSLRLCEDGYVIQKICNTLYVKGSRGAGRVLCIRKVLKFNAGFCVFWTRRMGGADMAKARGSQYLAAPKLVKRKNVCI